VGDQAKNERSLSIPSDPEEEYESPLGAANDGSGVAEDAGSTKGEGGGNGTKDDSELEAELSRHHSSLSIGDDQVFDDEADSSSGSSGAALASDMAPCSDMDEYFEKLIAYINHDTACELTLEVRSIAVLLVCLPGWESR
tara:strand:- start:33 stop:452 length:420 start_codon:yes stop_codon:yes gene_type:complete